MWIEMKNDWARVVRADPAERAWLAEFLSFDDARSRFSGADPKVRMLNDLSGAFPAGFVPLVRKAAAEAGVAVEVADQRTVPARPDPNADLAWLRSHPGAPGKEIVHQVAAVEAVVKATRGILHLPTGAGKTEIAVGLTRRLPCRWLLLVHRSTLVEQAAERYERRTGERAGRIMEGTWDVGSKHLCCATFQTVHAARVREDPRARELLNEWAEGLMVDEAHTLPADTFWATAMAARRAYFRVGLSATPLARGDRRSVMAIGALGPVIHRTRPEELIELGVLSRPKIRMEPITHPPMGPEVTWQGAYGRLVARGVPRNRLLVEMAKRARKPAFLFVKEVAHGRDLVKRLGAAGIKAEFTWGSKSTEERRAAIRRLEHGDVEVLVCSVVFQEGVDVPDLRAVIIGSGGSSAIAAVQRLGRGSRRAAGKDEFEVWDVDDRGNRWLEKHSRARARAYMKEGFEVDRDAPIKRRPGDTSGAAPG